MTAGEIYNYLCTLAPIETQMSFDNAGFLVGSRETVVKKVILSLDVTDKVVDEAFSEGAQLIISHHPVIFDPIKNVLSENSPKLIKLIKNDICVISMHTNLDIAEGGVNDVLLALLGAERLGYLDSDNCGRYGEYEREISIEAFLRLCRDALNAEGMRYVPGKRPIKRIAVLGGSGGDCLEDAIEKNCDAYVTADVKYHEFLDAAEKGITLVDADHFCTENPVMYMLLDKLTAQFPTVDFRISNVHKQTVRSM